MIVLSLFENTKTRVGPTDRRPTCRHIELLFAAKKHKRFTFVELPYNPWAIRPTLKIGMGVLRTPPIDKDERVLKIQ